MTMSVTLLVYIACVYLVAGYVKGVVGLGLPTISLALLAAVLGLKEAMVVLLVPSFVTNVVQAVAGGGLLTLTRRLWTFLLLLCVCTWISAGILARVDSDVFAIGLGIILIIYSGLSLMRAQITAPGKREAWLGPLMGAFTGISTGLTGTFVVPGVLYLQSLNLGKKDLVQAMGLCFTVATLALGISLENHGIFKADLAVVSCAMVVPALIGMAVGVKVRGKIDEFLFRRIFFIALLGVGIWIVIAATI
ncbi:MAG: hypothetical protein CMM58_06560 [Rhodospirillaceae bacterium]|nr:hypothetical protein [Rhodospirillaceae bacterium]